MRYLIPAVLLVSACTSPESRRSSERIPATPYERYVAALRSSGLESSGMARDWIAAGERALDQALPMFAPFTKIGYFDPAEVRAVAYSIPTLRGQRIVVDLDVESGDSSNLFVDLYRQLSNGRSAPVHVAAADSTTMQIDFVAYWDGEFVVRIQPELLRGGRYRLTVRNSASLAFPVYNHDSEAIRSVFGDPRDGGSRSHHGVDIFAPRGTPVLAGRAGRVSFVGNNRLGGKVVWLRDAGMGVSYYYAHLDSQVVRRGASVQPGDTLGLVGNSGNARTTPPHLHFGVYVRGSGPVDPWPFVHEPDRRPSPLNVESSLLGQLGRLTRATVLRAAPSRRGDLLLQLDALTPVKLIAGTGSWYHVELPDGAQGFVDASATESIDSPVRSVALVDSAELKDTPLASALIKDIVGPQTAAVLAEFRDNLLVRTDRGTIGWWNPGSYTVSAASAGGR